MEYVPILKTYLTENTKNAENMVMIKVSNTCEAQLWVVKFVITRHFDMIMLGL